MEEVITIMLLNLKVAVLDNSANLGIIKENRRNSVKSKKEAKYIRINKAKQKQRNVKRIKTI